MSVLPSVTQIIYSLELGSVFSNVDPALLRSAQELGTAVHAAIYDDCYGVLDSEELEPVVRTYVAQWRAWADQRGYRLITAEHRVESAVWAYQGHLDSAGWISTDRVLLDVKCMSTMDEQAVALQLAGYDLAWTERRPCEPFTRYLGLQLMPERFVEYDVTRLLPEARTLWRAAVRVYHEQQRRRR